jgi:hypothetical protein
LAFSGTISETVFNTDKVLRSAVRRCKLPTAQITSEHWEIAGDALYLMLSDLANQGVPLWCIERQIYPLYEGVAQITMDVGTVDVLNTYFRSLSEATGTNTDTSTRRTIEFESETAVTTVGIKWSAASVPLIFERSDDGATWTAIQSEADPEAASGEWTWFDMEEVIAADWFRVRATSGTLSFSTLYTGNNPTEIPMARMNRDNWTALTNKAFPSEQPLQFWFDRQVPQPIMRLWPMPSEAAETHQVIAWRHRHIMDVGTLTQELDIPQRWYEAIVSGLARKLAREFVEVDPKVIPMLDTDAAMALRIAQDEEQDSSPTTWAPNFSCYTA